MKLHCLISLFKHCKNTFLFSLCLLLGMSISHPLLAQKTWTGLDGTPFWDRADNWSPVGVPTATDDVIIQTVNTNVLYYPVISTTDAKAKSVIVSSATTLTIASTGQLTINGWVLSDVTNISLKVSGTLENNGKLILGNDSALDDTGLYNTGVVKNNAGAELSIDRTKETALHNISPGVMTNAGTIQLGKTNSIGSFGVKSVGIFDNKVGGVLQIDRCSSNAISLYNSDNKFTNEGVVKIGSLGSAAATAIYQGGGTFDNKLGGKIFIDGFLGFGFILSDGTVRNYAAITIGAIAGGIEAVRNASTFLNEGCNAVLSIQSNSVIVDLTLTLRNSGVIIEKATGSSNIGSNTGLVHNLNGGLFNVGAGPNPVLSATPITPSNGSDGAINIKGLLNDTYAVTYTKDGGTPTTTNVTVTTNELTIPALGAGSYAITLKGTTCSTLEFNLSTTIVNPTLTLGTATQPATCTGTGSISFGSTGYGSGTQTVSYSYQASSSATAETRTASVNIGSDGGFTLANLPIGIYSQFAIGGISATGSRVINVKGDATGVVWTGCVNADWHNAANWNKLAVPTATDDVEIQTVNTGLYYPIISTTDAKAKSVKVNSSTTLAIASTGQLTINGSKTFSSLVASVFVAGTLENNGKLVLGNESTLGKYGVYNSGVFNNKTGAELRIDRTTEIALYNEITGVIANMGTIQLGQTQPAGLTGLNNFGAFGNKAGALLQIDRSTSSGLNNTSYGTFTNEGVVKVGSLESVGYVGIRQSGNFDNKLGGQITIDRFINEAIFHDGGSVKNYASITIGAIAGGTVSVNSNSTFLNEGCSALLSVQSNSTISASTLNNSGGIIEKASGNSTIGSNTGLVQNLNGGVFNVGTGPNPVLSAIPRSPKTFNGGDGSINIQGLLNGTYEVTYIKDGGSPITTNLTATANELTIPALGVGSFAITVKATSCSTLEFSLSTTIVNPTLTLQATNRPVSCTGTGSISFGSTGYGSGTQTVSYSYQASSSATAETRTASVNIGSDGGFTLANLPIGVYSQFAIGGVVATGSRVINVKFSNTALLWTGCANTDWHNAANWNTLAVPTATDEVEIQETSDSKPYPIISTTDAKAKSVYVYANTTLTIANSGQLTINGARSSGVSASVLVAGTLVNNGKLVLGNEDPLGTYGLISVGVFNNNAGAELMIDRSRESALTNNPNAVMTNAGTIQIGQMQAVGLVGLENSGQFENKVGGMIRIDRASSVGLTNLINSTFTNEGVVKIGSVENIGGTGIGQNGSFDNKQGGEITIDKFLTFGINNQAGTFRNYASIIIGAIAGGSIGVNNAATFSNEGCGSLLSVQSNSTITTGLDNFFKNEGIIIEKASGDSRITRNNGLVQNLNGGTFTIQQPGLSLPVLSAVGVPPSNCPTNNNGSISVVGLEANTEYIVVLGAGGTPQTLTSDANGRLSVGNLSVGTYTFTLKKACWPQAISVTTTIAAPTLTNGSSTIGATCTTAGRIVFDTNLGFTSTPTTYPATFKRNGVSQSGQLSINNSSGTINSIILVSEEGYYSDIKVQYGTCEVTYVGTVYVPGAVSAPTITPPTACATTNGSVRFSTSVNAGTYTLNYKKNGESATASITVVAAGRGRVFTLSDLGAGVYTDFSLTAGSCTTTYSPIIRVGDLPNPSVSGTTAVTTLGGTDGNIKLSGLAVSKSYSISYQKDGATATTTTASSDADGNLTIPNLGGGNYTNIILTISGCSSSALSATVNAPVAYSFAYGSTVAPSGCGTTDGALVFTTNLPVGANAYILEYTSFGNPYNSTISVTAASGGGNTFTLSGLGAGSYRDFSIMYNGSRLSLEGIYSLSNPDKPTFAVGTKTSPSSCNATDGSIQLTGLLASTNYGISYQKDGGMAVTATLGSDASGNLVIGGLGAGAYTNIKVTLKGCQSDAATATISAPTFTLTQTSSSNPTTCGATDGSISFSTSLPTGTYTLTYKKNGEVATKQITFGATPTRIAAGGNVFVLTGLGAGSYSEFKIVYNGCEVTLAGPYTLLGPSLATATISGTVTACQNAAAPSVTFTGANGAGSYTFEYRINGGVPRNITTTNGSSMATVPQATTSAGVFTYELLSVSDANCSQNQSGTVVVKVVGKPTITLTTLQQTLNEGNSQEFCDTDSNPVNTLQFSATTGCIVGTPVWRVQVGSGAWSNWSTNSPVSQSSNNQSHRYQAACDVNCPVTYTSPIEVKINYRASTPQQVSLVVDGVLVNEGETKEVCNVEGNAINFNATCAAGEVVLYSVDGGDYNSVVPTQLVDGQFHNYRVRCRKSDGMNSCIESESGVMRLKISNGLGQVPVASLNVTSGCGTPVAFSGTASCGSLTTVWYNASTNIALPTLPSQTPSETTSYYARCQASGGCLSEKSNVVTFTIVPVNVAPAVNVSASIVCTGSEVTISTNCPAGTTALWNTGVTESSFKVSFANVTKQTYSVRCVSLNGCQSAVSATKEVTWKAFEVTLINIGQSKSGVKSNDRNAWSSQFITRDGGPELEQSTQVSPTLYYVENVNKVAPRYWTINVDACALGTGGSLTFDLLATPETGVPQSFNTHENNAPYFMYANRDGWTELYAQNHPAYGFYQDNGVGGNVYDGGLPKGLYKLGIRYWDQKGWGSIYPSTRKPQGNVLAYQEYWFRIQSKSGVGVGAARTADSGQQEATDLSSRRFADARDLLPNIFAQVMPNPVSTVLRLQVQDSKGQLVQTTLTDASGRQVLGRDFVPETNSHLEEFGVSELANGVYFLRVQTDTKQEILKVIKVK